MEPDSFWTHLDELRRVLIKILTAVAVTSGLAFFLAKPLFQFLLIPYVSVLKPGILPMTGLQSLDPTETFKISVEIAILAGLAISSPYTLRTLWLFVAPGLTPREKRVLTPLLIAGLGLFALGALFAYSVALPLSLHFFWNYSLDLGVAPAWGISHYFTFLLTSLTAFGIAFELPILVSGLTLFGVVEPAQLRRWRRYAYFGILLIAALLTPPDIISMLAMGIPLLLLYEISILLSRLIQRKRNKAA